MRRADKFGFTLTELMVVVVIVGILAAIALPNYVATREKALDKEALAGLKLIRAGERQFFAISEVYNPSVVGAVLDDITAINTALATDLNEANWDYRITGVAGPGFSSTATRIGGGRVWTATQGLGNATCAGTCY